jgi:hypothetical protein
VTGLSRTAFPSEAKMRPPLRLLDIPVKLSFTRNRESPARLGKTFRRISPLLVTRLKRSGPIPNPVQAASSLTPSVNRRAGSPLTSQNHLFTLLLHEGEVKWRST